MPFDLGTHFNANLHRVLQAIVTVLAVINPVMCGSIFLTLTPELGSIQRRWVAVKVALSILIILATSALIGLKVLSIFNVSLEAFGIVGGIIIAYMGFNMLGGRHTANQAPSKDHEADTPRSLFPLIMFAAGPGSITAVVTLAAVHTPDGFPATAITAAIVGAAVTFAALLLAIQAGSHLGQSTQAVVTAFMGLIVASMGMQFVLTGLKGFLHLT